MSPNRRSKAQFTRTLINKPLSSGILPLRRSVLVIDKVHSTIGVNSFFCKKTYPVRLKLSTSTLSQRKGRAPQPFITWGGGGGSASQGWGVSQPGGGGPPRQRQCRRDSIRPIRLTVALGLKSTEIFHSLAPQENILNIFFSLYLPLPTLEQTRGH